MLLDAILEPTQKFVSVTVKVAICSALLFTDPNMSFASTTGTSTTSTTEISNLDTIGGNTHGNDNIGSFSVKRLKSCAANTNCVSSNYLEPPNRYISPFSIVNDREVAFQRAVRDLNRMENDAKNYENINARIAEVIPKDHYIHLTVPGSAPNSLDDIELYFPEDSGIVNVRCEARVTLPPPPFCIKKNCINGNMDQRRRLEKVSYALGLPPSDQKQMKDGAKWTPIFFNSDRVPDMVDDE